MDGDVDTDPEPRTNPEPDTNPYPDPEPDPIAEAAAAVLNAIVENDRPWDLHSLRRLALQLRVPVIEAPLDDGKRGLCWLLGWGNHVGKVYLVLPRLIEHRFHRWWSGPAEVVLLGEATTDKAVKLLLSFARLLSSNPPARTSPLESRQDAQRRTASALHRPHGPAGGR